MNAPAGHGQFASIRAVLFDLDGTLVDSFHAHYRVYVRLFRDLGWSFDEVTYTKQYSPNWYIFYERLGLPKPLWNEADRLWLYYYAQEAPPKRTDADEVLAALRKSGRVLGLVTSGERSRVERDLQRLQWQSVFDIVVCGGDVPERKPHPAPLAHALHALQTAPPRGLYVGDTVEDVAMGKAVGAMTAAILGGFSSRDAFAPVTPDAIFESLQDLILSLRS